MTLPPFIQRMNKRERVLATMVAAIVLGLVNLFLWSWLLGAIRSAKNAEQIENALQQKQITYLMAREDLLASFLSNNLTSDQARIWNDFAANKIKVSFRDRGYAVYQLHG